MRATIVGVREETGQRAAWLPRDSRFLISLTKGESLIATLTVYRSSGAPLDLTGKTVEVQIKRAPTDLVALIAPNVAITDPVRGVCSFALVPADTSHHDVVPGKYVWDAWVVEGSVREPVVALSTFQVLPGVTGAVTLPAVPDDMPASVATLAELSTYAVTGWSEGRVVWVRELKSPFRYMPSSTLTVDGITVVAALGGGRFERDEYSSPEWAALSTWHIDFQGGADTNLGTTQGAALKTLGELIRRLGRFHVFTHNVAIYTYNETSWSPSDALEKVDWTVWNLLAGIAIGDMVRVRFYASAADIDYAGTFTAVQANVRATNTPCTVTNALDPWPVYSRVPPSGGAWSTPSGWRLRITSGPRAGAVAWVKTAAGLSYPAGTQHTTVWAIQDADPVNGFTEVVPQPGDTYVREAPKPFFLGDITIRGSVGNNAWWSYLCIDGYTVFGRYGFDTQTPTPTWLHITGLAGGMVVFRNCNIATGLWATQLSADSSCYVQNCSSYPLAFSGIGFVYVDLGSVHPTCYAAQGSRVFVDGGCEGGFVALDGGIMSLLDCCAFGVPAHAYPAAIAAEHQGVLILGASFYTGVCTVWGVTQAQYGLAVIEGAQFEVDPALLPGVTLTGADGDFCVGPPQTPGAPATACSWNQTTDPPTLTTKRTCTWAHLAAPIAGGGFDYNAHDMAGHAHIVKEFI